MIEKEMITRMQELDSHITQTLKDIFNEPLYYCLSLTTETFKSTLNIGNLPDVGLALFLQSAVFELFDSLSEEEKAKFTEAIAKHHDELNRMGMH